jgi:hypothetical protein
MPPNHPVSRRPQPLRVTSRTSMRLIGEKFRRCGSLKAAPTTRRSLRPVEFLAFEADPFAVMVLPRAESGRHHGHAAGRTDRRMVVSIHATSTPYSRSRSLFVIWFNGASRTARAAGKADALHLDVTRLSAPLG